MGTLLLDSTGVELSGRAPRYKMPMNDFPLPEDHGTTRVPNAVIAALLDDDTDKATIALVLRALWWLERSRDFPKSVAVADLRTDRVLATKLGHGFDSALSSAVSKGVLLAIETGAAAKVLLNTESAARLVGDASDPAHSPAGDWDTPVDRRGPADAYREYEENIAPLTPMTRDALSQALQDFTDEQIVDAIRIAVENETRNWSFIAAVLRKWKRGGIPHEPSLRGRPGGQRLSEGELGRYLEQKR